MSAEDTLSSGFVAGCGEEDILEVSFWIGIERHPQSRPVHESKIKDHFEGLEQRPRVDLVVRRCHVPAGCQGGGSDESGDSSPVYVRQEPQGDLMTRASRDSRVNNNVWYQRERAQARGEIEVQVGVPQWGRARHRPWPKGELKEGATVIGAIGASQRRRRSSAPCLRPFLPQEPVCRDPLSGSEFEGREPPLSWTACSGLPVIPNARESARLHPSAPEGEAGSSLRRAARQKSPAPWRVAWPALSSRRPGVA